MVVVVVVGVRVVEVAVETVVRVTVSVEVIGEVRVMVLVEPGTIVSTLDEDPGVNM